MSLEKPPPAVPSTGWKIVRILLRILLGIVIVVLVLFGVCIALIR